jgi:hypothetical protein
VEQNIPRQPHRPTGASLATLIGVGIAVAGVVVLHVVRSTSFVQS